VAEAYWTSVPGRERRRFSWPRRGFDVTATDVSGAAIDLAKTKAERQDINIVWKQDDILQTGLTRQFDFILDRGCFHVLRPDRRQAYFSTVAGLLKPDGYLFLK